MGSGIITSINNNNSNLFSSTKSNEIEYSSDSSVINAQDTSSSVNETFDLEKDLLSSEVYNPQEKSISSSDSYKKSEIVIGNIGPKLLPDIDPSLHGNNNYPFSISIGNDNHDVEEISLDPVESEQDIPIDSSSHVSFVEQQTGIDVTNITMESLDEGIQDLSSSLKSLEEQFSHYKDIEREIKEYLDKYKAQQGRTDLNMELVKEHLTELVKSKTDFENYDEYNEFITSLKVSISECNSYIYKLNTVKKELPYWQITNTVEYDSFNCDILDEEINSFKNNIEDFVRYEIATPVIDYGAYCQKYGKISKARFVALLLQSRFGEILPVVKLEGFDDFEDYRNLLESATLSPDLYKLCEYVTATEGEDGAKEFLKTMSDTINLNVGTIHAQKFISKLHDEKLQSGWDFDKAFSNHIKVHFKGIYDGVEDFFQGIDYILSTETSTGYTINDYESMKIMEALMSDERFDSVLSTNYKIGKGAGNALPTILFTSIFPESAGASLLSNVLKIASSSGNNIKETINQGYSLNRSLVHAVASNLTDIIFGKFGKVLPGLYDQVDVNNLSTFLKAMGQDRLSDIYSNIFRGLEKSAILDHGFSLTENVKGTIQSFVVGMLTSAEIKGEQALIKNTIDIINKSLDIFAHSNPELRDLEEILEEEKQKALESLKKEEKQSEEKNKEEKSEESVKEGVVFETTNDEENVEEDSNPSGESQVVEEVSDEPLEIIDTDESNQEQEGNTGETSHIEEKSEESVKEGVGLETTNDEANVEEDSNPSDESQVIEEVSDEALETISTDESNQEQDSNVNEEKHIEEVSEEPLEELKEEAKSEDEPIANDETIKDEVEQSTKQLTFDEINKMDEESIIELINNEDPSLAGLSFELKIELLKKLNSHNTASIADNNSEAIKSFVKGLSNIEKKKIILTFFYGYVAKGGTDAFTGLFDLSNISEEELFQFCDDFTENQKLSLINEWLNNHSSISSSNFSQIFKNYKDGDASLIKSIVAKSLDRFLSDEDARVSSKLTSFLCDNYSDEELANLLKGMDESKVERITKGLPLMTRYTLYTKYDVYVAEDYRRRFKDLDRFIESDSKERVELLKYAFKDFIPEEVFDERIKSVEFVDSLVGVAGYFDSKKGEIVVSLAYGYESALKTVIHETIHNISSSNSSNSGFRISEEYRGINECCTELFTALLIGDRERCSYNDGVGKLEVLLDANIFDIRGLMNAYFTNDVSYLKEHIEAAGGDYEKFLKCFYDAHSNRSKQFPQAMEALNSYIDNLLGDKAWINHIDEKVEKWNSQIKKEDNK